MSLGVEGGPALTVFKSLILQSGVQLRNVRTPAGRLWPNSECWLAGSVVFFHSSGLVVVLTLDSLKSSVECFHNFFHLNFVLYRSLQQFSIIIKSEK